MKISRNYKRYIRNHFDVLFQNKIKMPKFRLGRIIMHWRSYEDFTKHVTGFNEAHEILNYLNNTNYCEMTVLN